VVHTETDVWQFQAASQGQMMHWVNNLRYYSGTL